MRNTTRAAPGQIRVLLKQQVQIPSSLLPFAYQRSELFLAFLAIDGLEFPVTKTATGGFKIDAIGFDASGKATSESTHIYSLSLTRGPKRKGVLGVEAIEVANAIFAISAATREISTRTSDFYVNEATVTVDLTRSKEGGLKVFGGGEGKSGNTCRATLKFAVRET